MTQLQQLAMPFPSNFVKDPPQGKHGQYVPHHIVGQRALEIVGPHSFQVTEPIRGYAEEIKGQTHTWPAREGAIVGCLATLSVVIDETEVYVTEVGTEDQPAMNHDAENLKRAASDAYKRCWMRLGLGLHLWAQADYFLSANLGDGTE